MLNSSMSATVSALKRTLPAATKDATEQIGDMLRDRIAYHTPVGKRFDPGTGEEQGESGHLKKEWKRGSVRKSGPGEYTVDVTNDVSYAPYVERGTKAHVIEAKAGMALRFWSRGELMFRRSVKHPAVMGRFMMTKGAADVEREWEERVKARFAVAFREAERDGQAGAERRF